MKIYIDCEFNGFGRELISLGMIAEDGRQFYGVPPEPRIWDAWCADNVLPVLYSVHSPRYDSYGDFRESFLDFMGGFESPTIVADWPADLFYFFQIMLGRDHRETESIACQTELVSIDYVSEIPHNALADAHAIKIALEAKSMLG